MSGCGNSRLTEDMFEDGELMGASNVSVTLPLIF
jgi:hypothetical protein